MKPEQTLNAETKHRRPSPHLAVAEVHALDCWKALERHANGPSLCGCYRHHIAGHIVVHKSCQVGEACAEEYEIASRRVREIVFSLEAGDFEPRDPSGEMTPEDLEAMGQQRLIP